MQNAIPSYLYDRKANTITITDDGLCEPDRKIVETCRQFIRMIHESAARSVERELGLPENSLESTR
jgi:hypothetical protein